jgi:predicted ArsR family transcriptional regulator
MTDAIVSSAGMRIVKLLVGQPPLSIGELIEEAGVTRTAITEQLNELAASGFVERTIERLPGRGRPRHRFAATRAAMVLLFANNQQLVVPAIWKAIDEIGGKKLVRKIVHSVGRELSEYYRARITASDPKKRLDQFTTILEKEGGLVDLTARNGQVTITKRSCAFISMFEEQRHVCEIDLDLIASIVGCPVRMSACRHDGSPFCRFEIDTRAGNGSQAT